jgi:drug/metabolite transporter (DMT)-like permease
MKLKLILAYIATVLIWSTTPLAIQWSQDSFTSIQALFWRMFLAWLMVFSYLIIRRDLPKLTAPVLTLYAISGGGLFIAMGLIYNAAPFIDTGLVAIIHGLLPLFTAFFAYVILQARLSAIQWTALMVSFGGMVILFYAEMQSTVNISFAFGAVLLAVMTHSLTAVLIKRKGVSVSVPHQLFGALSVATSCLFLWLTASPEPMLPDMLTSKSSVSIGYLAFVGSVCGFFFYYYLLKQVSPITVGTITLITPVMSMLIGGYLNQERFPLGTLIGTGILLIGLTVYLSQGQKKPR